MQNLRCEEPRGEVCTSECGPTPRKLPTTNPTPRHPAPPPPRLAAGHAVTRWREPTAADARRSSPALGWATTLHGAEVTRDAPLPRCLPNLPSRPPSPAPPPSASRPPSSLVASPARRRRRRRRRPTVAGAGGRSSSKLRAAATLWRCGWASASASRCSALRSASSSATSGWRNASRSPRRERRRAALAAPPTNNASEHLLNFEAHGPFGGALVTRLELHVNPDYVCRSPRLPLRRRRWLSLRARIRREKCYNE